MTDAPADPRRPRSALVMFGVLALAGAGVLVVMLLARDVPRDRGAVAWGALVLGAIAVLGALLERDGRPDIRKRISASTAILHAAGPTGSRLLVALLAGGAIGFGAALMTGAAPASSPHAVDSPR